MLHSAYATCFIACMTSMVALWGLSIHTNIKNPSLPSAFFGLGMMMQALMCIPIANFSFHSLLVTFLVAAWGLRNSHHSFQHSRRLLTRRYYEHFLRDHGGENAFTAFIYVFMLDALSMFVVGLPIQHAATHHASMNSEHIWGVFIALLGFGIETIADSQLAEFRAVRTNKGKVLDTGLWKYSRHPNFFGSCVYWLGIYILCSSKLISWTMVSPILLTYLILNVAGIHVVEAIMHDRPAYQEYMRCTSIFIPWFAKASRTRSRSPTAPISAGIADEKSETEKVTYADKVMAGAQLAADAVEESLSRLDAALHSSSTAVDSTTTTSTTTTSSSKSAPAQEKSTAPGTLRRREGSSLARGPAKNMPSAEIATEQARRVEGGL